MAHQDIWHDAPWEHPDWYDLHDTTYTAGPGREPEHYAETVLALPRLDQDDHLVDAGAGTGKLALLIARSYPRLGHITLIEPNADKLQRAYGRLCEALPAATVTTLAAGLGLDAALPQAQATVVTLGSVLMPNLELQGGTLGEGLGWLRRCLADLYTLLRPGGWLFAAETLAAPWARGGPTDPARRLTLPELTAELAQAGFDASEVVYRFRDRIVVKARRPRG